MMLELIIIVILLLFIYFRILRIPTFWSDKNVPQKNVWPIFGHSASMFFKKKTKMDLVRDAYNQFPNERYAGIYQFGLPILLIKDPDLVKQITIKDFNHFTDHKSLISEDVDYLWSHNLFNLKGNEWKNVRTTLTPAFTGSKMKTMFSLMTECVENYVDYYVKRPEIGQNIDTKDSFSRFANDVIGRIGFGIKCDSFTNEKNEFYLMGKEATNFSGFFKLLSFTIAFVKPTLAKMLGVRVFSKRVANYFTRVIKESIQFREKNNVRRPDFLQLLLETRKKSDDTINHRYLTDEDITAQCLLLFIGGFETVSQTMNFLAYELAIHPEIQEQLQEEIDIIHNECDGTLTYDILMKMKYLDMVVSEILRKYPPFVTFDRICVKPYIIQPTRPNEKPILLDKDQMLWLSPYAIQRDEKYYPNPERFDPERFNDDNRHNITPYIYYPFGIGPRNCIGSRFALLEIKLLFYHLIRKFTLIPTKETIIPLTYRKAAVNIMPEKPIILTMQLREN